MADLNYWKVEGQKATDSTNLFENDVSVIEDNVTEDKASIDSSELFDISAPLNLSLNLIGDVASVKSLTMLSFCQSNTFAEWRSLSGKLNFYNKRLVECLAYTGNSADVIAALNRMSSRWTDLRTKLKSSFSPCWDSIDTAALLSLKSDEETDRTYITAAKYNGLLDASQNLTNNIQQFVTDKIKIDQEKILYQRFNAYFTSSTVIKLLRVTSSSLTSANIKAIISQESTDLTNIKLSGIEDKTTGIITNLANRHACVGIAQMQTSARTDAINWAQKKGVTINTDPDPRLDPLKSIELMCAYLGRIYDYLVSNLPSPLPDSLNLKLLTIAGYNWSVFKLVDQITKSFMQNQRYDYNSVEKYLPSETQIYIKRIIERLTY